MRRAPSFDRPPARPGAGPLWTRRRALGGLAAGLSLLPAIACVGDGPGAGSEGSTTGDGTTTGDETTTSSTTATSTSTSTSTSTTDGGCEPAAAWATGGTASMTAKACYPDPFAGGVATCALICATTPGPCTAPTSERQDVSEGWSGLPMRLALKIVRADGCTPVAGASVEIWHTQRTGVYSGQTPKPATCAGGDADAPNHNYFRGAQTTDADGRVDFDSCFPGWYPSRALHIHFRVVLDGASFVVSQLFFGDAITAEIFAIHPEYQEFGEPDTSNASDGVIGDVDDLAPYLLDVARMADGALLASKVIAIRSAAEEPLCSA